MSESNVKSRRKKTRIAAKFLAGSAVASGAAITGFPMIRNGASSEPAFPVHLARQDIFHEYANDKR